MIDLIQPAQRRFLKYSVVGVSTFIFDLLLLFVLTDYVGINYIVAAGAAFVVAVSINYAVSRTYVFRGTERGVQSGYGYFIAIALIGLLFVMVSMYVLVDVLALHYLVSRVCIAGITGVFNYLTNLYLNFKVVGKH